MDDQRFFEQLVRNTDDAILFADREGTIRFWNQGAERVFGYSQEDAVGETLDIIIPERYREPHWEGYYRAIEAGETPYEPGELLSVPAVDADGERVSATLTITAIREEDGELAGLGAIARDVTERYEREQELEDRIEELEARIEELSE